MSAPKTVIRPAAKALDLLPAKCPACKGACYQTNLRDGTVFTCPDCGGSGVAKRTVPSSEFRVPRSEPPEAKP